MAGAIVPVFNIVLGVLALVAGYMGKLSFFGLGPEALMVAGGVGVALGVYQLWRRNTR